MQNWSKCPKRDILQSSKLKLHHNQNVCSQFIMLRETLKDFITGRIISLN